jgi:hypothetical protein
VLIKEFLIPLAPNSLHGVAIYRSVEETAIAASCLYELARNSSKSYNVLLTMKLTRLLQKQMPS